MIGLFLFDDLLLLRTTLFYTVYKIFALKCQKLRTPLASLRNLFYIDLSNCFFSAALLYSIRVPVFPDFFSSLTGFLLSIFEMLA